MLLGPCHGNVQLAVDYGAVHIFESGVGKESQLIIMADGESVDDIPSLAALKSLHGVDCDVVQCVDAVAGYAAAYGGYLVAVGHYHAYGSVGVESLMFDFIVSDASVP